MDDFPVIVPEDGGFAIYLNDEKVDWYNNEADAEGVALSMVDKELNDESFFDDDTSRLFKKICNESIIRRYLYYCRDCRLEYYAGSEEPQPCPRCGKENKILEVQETYWG